MANKKTDFVKEEKRLSEIYSHFWKKFDKKQFKEAASLFGKRLTTNHFDLNWFKGKICLDAGCGSGRYIQAMLDLKVKKVIGIDLDIETARKNVKNSKAEIIKGDIRNIPFNNEYFDFVCCNGVLHHLKEPKKAINEISRVLKRNGYLFLYVFDKVTQDWEVIDKLREAVRFFPAERLRIFLKQNLNLPENTLFSFCDMLYAPIQNKFTRQELREFFKDFEVKFFKKTFTDYDSSKENRLLARKK